jgi:hypothetical protein
MTTIQISDKTLESHFRRTRESETSDYCIEWTGGKIEKGGYGMSWFRGHNILAHRMAWMIHHGRSIPDGMVIMHTCDNPSCVNPEHLLCASQQTNVMDMYIKGRAPNKAGEHNPRARLTQDDVDNIRSMVDLGLATRRQMAEFYGVGYSTIVHILLGRTWH